MNNTSWHLPYFLALSLKCIEVMSPLEAWMNFTCNSLHIRSRKGIQVFIWGAFCAFFYRRDMTVNKQTGEATKAPNQIRTADIVVHDLHLNP